MRLVSSRLHRCYSRTNINTNSHQHSRRRPPTSLRRGVGVGVEQWLCVLHVAASVMLIDHTNWAIHFLISPSASPIASPIRTASIAALLLVHAVDFLSALDAHRLFYRRLFLLVKQQEEQQRRDEQLQEMSSPPRWLSTMSPKGAPTFSMATSATTTTAAATSTTGAAATSRPANHNSNDIVTDRGRDQRGTTSSSSSRPSLRSFLRSFVSSPGVHDMAVAGVFLIASSVLLLSAGHYHQYQAQHRLVEPPPSPAQERARLVQVRCTLFFALLTVIGSVMNIILCLPYPSLSFANAPAHQQSATHPTQSATTSTLSSSSSPSFALLCRLHTGICAAFVLCGAVKLMGLQILMYTMPEPHRDMVHFVSSVSKAVDAIAAVCAVINLVRVTMLASATSTRAALEAKRLRLSMANANRGDPGATRAGAGAWWGRLFHNHQHHRRNATRYHPDDDYLDDEGAFLQDLPMHTGDTHGHGSSSRGRD